MQYIFLLYSNEARDPEPPPDPEAFAAYMQPWADFSAHIESSGAKILGGEALQPTATATTVSAPSPGAAPVLTDGPFAETKEQLGGFYHIECADLDAALALAAKCPIVGMGGRVEVRPVMDVSGGPE
ncbi:MAG: YciI family protein [Myxococcota bacterium]